MIEFLLNKLDLLNDVKDKLDMLTSINIDKQKSFSCSFCNNTATYTVDIDIKNDIIKSNIS